MLYLLGLAAASDCWCGVVHQGVDSVVSAFNHEAAAGAVKTSRLHCERAANIFTDLTESHLCFVYKISTTHSIPTDVFGV